MCARTNNLDQCAAQEEPCNKESAHVCGRKALCFHSLQKRAATSHWHNLPLQLCLKLLSAAPGDRPGSNTNPSRHPHPCLCSPALPRALTSTAPSPPGPAAPGRAGAATACAHALCPWALAAGRPARVAAGKDGRTCGDALWNAAAALRAGLQGCHPCCVGGTQEEACMHVWRQAHAAVHLCRQGPEYGL